MFSSIINTTWYYTLLVSGVAYNTIEAVYVINFRGKNPQTEKKFADLLCD